MSDHRIIQDSSLKDPPNIFRLTNMDKQQQKETATENEVWWHAKSDDTEITNNRQSPQSRKGDEKSIRSHRSLLLLQTAAEQEATNKSIDAENFMMHKRLIALAKGRDSKALDEEIEHAR
jgi:hypothetical protein